MKINIDTDQKRALQVMLDTDTLTENALQAMGTILEPVRRRVEAISDEVAADGPHSSRTYSADEDKVCLTEWDFEAQMESYDYHDGTDTKTHTVSFTDALDDEIFIKIEARKKAEAEKAMAARKHAATLAAKKREEEAEEKCLFAEFKAERLKKVLDESPTSP